MIEIKNLTQAMRAALLDENERPGCHGKSTVAALVKRGMIEPTNDGWPKVYDYTEVGRRAAEALRAERCEHANTVDDNLRCPKCRSQASMAAAHADGPPDAFSPFWVRNLVDRVGRELHDMDMLAAAHADEPTNAYARGQRDTWTTAAKYLARAVEQSVKELGLTALLEASRAGASTAELAAIPQSREV